MPKLALTAALVSNALCPSDRKRVDLFDTITKGLVLEVRQSGTKTFYLRYQSSRGKTRQIKLADSRDVLLSQARRLADKARNRIALGEDPLEDKELLRHVPTFACFIDTQYLPYIKTYKRSWETDVCLLKNHLLPRFANRYLDAITRHDIQRLLQDRRSSGAAAESANRLIIMMRYIFNLAIRWEIPGIKSNPCGGVPLLEVNNKKERFLSFEETHRLYQAVCVSENQMLKYIVPMLILTGARKREVLDARWEDFDLTRRMWRIPMSKSGKARFVPLSDGALAVLKAVPSVTNNEYVFANPNTKLPYISIYCSWNTARVSAGLKDVRMHDLRHSFASLLINSGRTLYEVQHILGHTQVKTTQRYAHLTQDTLLDAANAATRAIGGVLFASVPNLRIENLSKPL